MASLTADDVQRALAPPAGDPVFQRLHGPAFRLEFGEDALGQPAIWIYVLIPDDVSPEVAGGPHLEERFRIRDALEAAGWDGPIYTRFRRASEDPLPFQPAATKRARTRISLPRRVTFGITQVRRNDEAASDLKPQRPGGAVPDIKPGERAGQRNRSGERAKGAEQPALR